MLMHALGARLNKTLREIGTMPWSEFVGWFAFFEIQKEEE